AAWVAKLESGGRTFGGDPTCTPGYSNNEGKGADEKATRNSLGYPEGPVAYFEHIDRWRAAGTFDGLVFR
nr:monooxygenase [bacterium]